MLLHLAEGIVNRYARRVLAGYVFLSSMKWRAVKDQVRLRKRLHPFVTTYLGHLQDVQPTYPGAQGPKVSLKKGKLEPQVHFLRKVLCS